MGSLSLSNSISKETKYENSDFSSVYFEDLKNRDTDSISTEALEKGITVLNTYTITSDAISGGMGSVWRVHHNSWNTDLAMKRPQPRFFAEGGDEKKAQFVKECEYWINLGLHPNIVSCYYVREIGGVPTIFSEWMDGGSLSDRIKDGSLYEGTETEIQERILDIAIQAARGLQYSHENGLIHQDFKPGNLLLTKEWDAKVADFGLAKAKSNLGDKSDTAKTTGYTLAYCPQEQVDREEPQKWMDVYSWALTVLEMYAGKRIWKTGAEVKDHFDEYPSQLAYTVSDELLKILKEGLTDHIDSFAEITDKLSDIYLSVVGTEYPRTDSKAAADTAGSLNNRALSFIDLGKTEDGIALLEKAAEKNLSHTDSVFNRALVLWRTAAIKRSDANNLLTSVKDEKERLECEKALKNEASGKVVLPNKEYRLPDGFIIHYQNGNRICGAYNNELVVWDLEKKVIVYTADPECSVCFQGISRDGKTILLEIKELKNAAVNSFYNKSLRRFVLVVSVDNGKILSKIDLIGKPLSPDGKSIDQEVIVAGEKNKAPEYFALLSADGHFVGVTRYSKEWKGGIPVFECITEIFSSETGESLSVAGGCYLLGFTDENRVVVYDKNNVIHFTGTADQPIMPKSEGIKVNDIFRDDKRQLFYSLNTRFGLIRLTAGFSSRLLICDVQKGSIVSVFNEEDSVWHGTSYVFNDEFFTLTGDGNWFLHINRIDEDHLDFEIWNVISGQFVENYDIEDDSATARLFYGLAHPEEIRYIPNRVDYRLSTIQSTKERLGYQQQFDGLLKRSREEFEYDDAISAVKTIDDAIKVKGFENSSKALKLRSEYGSHLQKLYAKRIVPVEEAAPEPVITELSAAEPSLEEQHARKYAEKLKAELLQRWSDNDPYSEWTTYARIGAKSLNGKYRLIHTMIMEKRDSPAQYDIEITHWHGCAVLDVETGEQVWQKDYLYTHDASDAPLGFSPRFFTEYYRVLISGDGTKLLVRGSDLQLIDINTGKSVKLQNREFIFACFINGNRSVLCQRSDKKVFIISVDGNIDCEYTFPDAEYGKARYIDEDSLAIKHGDSEQLCLIEWEYGCEKMTTVERAAAAQEKTKKVEPTLTEPENNKMKTTQPEPKKKGFFSRLFGKK